MSRIKSGKKGKVRKKMRVFVGFLLKLREIRENEVGATAVEYGLLAALIAVAIILAVTSVGNELKSVFNEVAGALS